MISEKVISMINDQINKELESAYIYQAMEIYIGNEHLFPGIENFLHVQVQEENAHAQLMIDFLHRLNRKVTLKAMEQPKAEYGSVLEVFEAALAHEKKITKSLNDIMIASVEENDFACQSFIRYFINEQVEEEESFLKHVDMLKFIKNDPNAMLIFDGQMAQRTFVSPTVNTNM